MARPAEQDSEVATCGIRRAPPSEVTTPLLAGGRQAATGATPSFPARCLGVTDHRVRRAGELRDLTRRRRLPEKPRVDQAADYALEQRLPLRGVVRRELPGLLPV